MRLEISTDYKKMQLSYFKNRKNQKWSFSPSQKRLLTLRSCRIGPSRPRSSAPTSGRPSRDFQTARLDNRIDVKSPHEDRKWQHDGRQGRWPGEGSVRWRSRWRRSYGVTARRWSCARVELFCWAWTRLELQRPMLSWSEIMWY